MHNLISSPIQVLAQVLAQVLVRPMRRAGSGDVGVGIPVFCRLAWGLTWRVTQITERIWGMSLRSGRSAS